MSLRSGEGNLLSAPHGSYVSWIGQEGLYVAQAPRFEPRLIVPSATNDAVTAAYPSTDGHSLFFIRGVARPGFGPYPEQDDRALWRVSMTGGVPQRLASGRDVPGGPFVFAPDGQSFVTAEGVMLYEHRLQEGKLERRPLLQNDPQHYAARRFSSLSYSPDGSKLAFVSWRQAKHSYVGLYDFGTGRLRYVDPGIFRDLSPAWSPDSREVVFARTPGNWTREYRFSTAREGAPWRLMVANATDGAVRTVWTADRGAGSVYRPFGSGAWMETDIESPSLLWAPSGKILFPWERTGWLSLYAVPASGGRAQQLTLGDGEVNLPSLSSDGRQVLYASNIGDITRLHLWRLALDGGTPQRITQGKGVEHSPRFLTADHYVYIGNSDGRMPNRRMVSLKSGAQISLTPSAQDTREHSRLWLRFADVEAIPVRARDGLVSHHLLMVPRTPPPSQGFPVIVASKGGPDGRVSPGYGVYSALGQYAVSRGYIFVEINYRGCFGYGLDYRLPPGRGATGASEVADLEALAEYLASRPDVDPRRIGIMGGSYGGHIVGLALSQLPQWYTAGVHMSGVSDWIVEMKKDDESQREDDVGTSAPPNVIRLSERMQIEDLAFASSPSSRISAWTAPTLITMGELDRDGHMESIVDLGYRLMEQGTHVEFHIAPDAGHVGPRARPQEKVFEFFERTLRGSLGPSQADPGLEPLP